MSDIPHYSCFGEPVTNRGPDFCFGCGGPVKRDSRKRYCNTCHAAYMREWRKTHGMSEEARHKDRVRSIAHTAMKRGKIVRKPCEICGDEKAEMHHPSYDWPLKVDWLCRRHHLELHRLMGK